MHELNNPLTSITVYAEYLVRKLESQGAEETDVEKLRRHDKPLVCGIYAKKSRPEFACDFLPGTPKISFGGEKSFFNTHLPTFVERTTPSLRATPPL